MGIKGISLAETVDYVSQYDKEEPKTIWKLGALDSEVFDLLGEDKNPMRLIADAVRFGLKGFENFTDGNGKTVRFDTVSRVVGSYTYKVVADNIMKIIPPQVKAELGNEIMKMSKLNEEEVKN